MTDEAINRLAEAIERLAEVLTEKGEKENPPHPLKEKTQKEIPNPRARACEETEFVRFFCRVQRKARPRLRPRGQERIRQGGKRLRTRGARQEREKGGGSALFP